MSEAGRKGKLTPELIEKITDYIKLGNNNKTAAALAGLGEATFYKYLAKSEEENPEPEFVEFRESIERARAEAEARAVATIRKAGIDGKWQASAWWLERKNPDEWGATSKVKQEITGANGAPLVVTDDDMRAAVLGLLRGGNGSISDRDDSESTSD
jgi:hypothetical protein